jgi:glycosyltransferase involved in cell wall biosynthesis
MLGWVNEADLLRLYQTCRGLILPAIEDAGIVPLESMACGRPALVLDKGGAAEAVIEGETGTLIHRCEPGAVNEAIDRAESVSFNTMRIRAHALEYGHEVFGRRFLTFVANALKAHG